MPIQNNIVMSEVEAEIKRRIQKAKSAIMTQLAMIGEECVNEARINGDYEDWTGNLRSSIGYTVLNNGRPYIEAITESNKGTDRATGVRTGSQFMEELRQKYSKGIVLIVVAGMNYAAYVEAKKDVLASARVHAERETPKRLRDLGFVKV